MVKLYIKTVSGLFFGIGFLQMIVTFNFSESNEKINLDLGYPSYLIFALILSSFIYIGYKKRLMRRAERIELKKTTFPYDGLQDEKNYPMVYGLGWNAPLPVVLQPLWEKIIKAEADNQLLPPILNLNYACRDILGKNVSKEKNFQRICTGALLRDQLPPISYDLAIHCGSEPSLSLKLWSGRLKIELMCSKWDKSYRPNYFPDCSFNLDIDTLDGAECLSLEDSKAMYDGPSYGEKGYVAHSGNFFRIATVFDKFGDWNCEYRQEFKTIRPFMIKFNELLTEFDPELPIK